MLFANEKSGVSGVFCNLGSLVLTQNVFAHFSSSAMELLQITVF